MTCEIHLVTSLSFFFNIHSTVFHHIGYPSRQTTILIRQLKVSFCKLKNVWPPQFFPFLFFIALSGCFLFFHSLNFSICSPANISHTFEEAAICILSFIFSFDLLQWNLAWRVIYKLYVVFFISSFLFAFLYLVASIHFILFVFFSCVFIPTHTCLFF